jgi:hypothetical protein
MAIVNGIGVAVGLGGAVTAAPGPQAETSPVVTIRAATTGKVRPPRKLFRRPVRRIPATPLAADSGAPA